MGDGPRVRSWDEAEQHVASLQARLLEVERRLRLVEKPLDTRATPLWRRIVFRIDGWPSWPFVVARPRWRPWRRLWTS